MSSSPSAYLPGIFALAFGVGFGLSALRKPTACNLILGVIGLVLSSLACVMLAMWWLR